MVRLGDMTGRMRKVLATHRAEFRVVLNLALFTNIVAQPAVYLTDLRLYRLVENCLALPSQQLPLCTSEYREKHRNPNSSLIATGLQDRTN